jgi:hypothetical protein
MRDSYDFSPSFYASRNGHKETVGLLHSAGARINNSSLHEATREGHWKIVEFLLASGHRADFPSALYANGIFGRTALEEACLNAKSSKDTDDWKERIYQCIKMLLPSKGAEAGKTGGKTMLHMALENTEPLLITHILLQFPVVWEHFNHPVHLHRDEEAYYYSPTKYVEHFCTGHNLQTQRALITLLKANKCEDKFYAHTVEQPEGAVGIPEDIAFAVHKQKRADHDHQEAIKRQRDLAERKRVIEAEDHQRRIAVDKERHEAIMRQQREQEEDEKQMAQRKQATARAHAQELAQERQAALVEENRTRHQAMSEESKQRQAIQAIAQSSELHHKQALANQEYSTLKQKLELEKQIASERERTARKEAEVVRGILHDRERTVKYEASMRAQGSGYT